MLSGGAGFAQTSGMRTWFLCWSAVLSLGLFAQSSVALEIVILRHAETRAEETGEHSPFNERHFSEAGQKQIEAITAALADKSFDEIIVSPVYPVFSTILPYLKETDQTAEFWPSLFECCRQPENGRRTSPPGLPIMLESEQHPYFLRRPDTPDVTPGDETNEEGALRIKKAAAQFKAQWGGSDARLLIVMPEFAGDRLAGALLGREIHLKSGAFVHLREEAGAFVLAGRGE